MSNLIRGFNILLRQFERTFPSLFGKFPPTNYGIVAVGPVQNVVPSAFSIKDLIGDGFVWAVPKHRRTIERRLQRKFGTPGLVWKMLVPKKHIRVCSTCGDHHEAGILCPTCYDKIRQETNLIKERIEKELKLDPVENDVVVLYDGEKAEHPEEFWKGKRIVEMEKPRPSWFSKNLLQKSTQPNSDSKELKKNSDLS